MEKKFIEAYEALTPRDRLCVDATVISLYEKELQLRKLTKEVTNFIDEQTATDSDGQ